MNEKEQVELQPNDWKVSSVEEFLGLTKAEATYIDLKLTLLDAYRRWREQKQVSPSWLAKQLELNVSSIAKMEDRDPSVSLDLLIQSLLTLGIPIKELAQIIASLEQTTNELAAPSIFHTSWNLNSTYQNRTVEHQEKAYA